MSLLVEEIAKQAQLTFSNCASDETFSENLLTLIRNVNNISAADLKINCETVLAAIEVEQSKTDAKPASIFYTDIMENETFSMVVFLLKRGAQIPLHDHPGMHGVLKVIHGTIEITSYSVLPNISGRKKLPHDIKNRVKFDKWHSLVPVERHTSKNVSNGDDPCVLRPNEANYHEICAVGGTAAFLDILAPPYDEKERDGHYYIALDTRKSDSEVKTWLLRRRPPANMWCEAFPYPGPKITL